MPVLGSYMEMPNMEFKPVIFLSSERGRGGETLRKEKKHTINVLPLQWQSSSGYYLQSEDEGSDDGGFDDEEDSGWDDGDSECSNFENDVHPVKAGWYKVSEIPGWHLPSAAVS